MFRFQFDSKEFGQISCDKNINSLGKTFASISKALGPNDKHFKSIRLTTLSQDQNETTLNDNSFADLTFDNFYGYGIQKLSTNSLGKTASTIRFFWCLFCDIKNSPPNYNVWKILGTLTNVNESLIGLNVNEIPANAIVNGNQLQLKRLTLRGMQNVVVKSNAFQNLKTVNYIEFQQAKIKKIEKEAFKFGTKSDEKLEMNFYGSDLADDLFESGSFDGAQRPLNIVFSFKSPKFFSESSFKSVLENKENSVSLYPVLRQHPYLDCEECKNLWLVNSDKKFQIQNAYCKSNPHKEKLYDPDVESKLKTKCK